MATACLSQLVVLVVLRFASRAECFFVVQPQKIEFYLYTGSAVQHRDVEQLFVEQVDVLRKSTFNASNPTRFLIHGWMNDRDAPVNRRLVDAYRRHRQPFNVIVVDWSAYAHFLYTISMNNLPAISKVVVDFIAFLRTHGGLNPRITQLVGFSLGAHLAGYVGKRMRRTGGTGGAELAAIVGLDAAGPLFETAPSNERLATGDATYVEAIHTGILALGIRRPVGRADFYPNWGVQQKGCGFDVLGTCDHSRAVEYFAESIVRPRGFWFESRRCSGGFEQIAKRMCTSAGVARMGGEPLVGVNDSKMTNGGVYYVGTRDASPYGIKSSVKMYENDRTISIHIG